MSDEDKNDPQNRHALKWYPLFQYSVLGAWFSCMDLSHLFSRFLEGTTTTSSIISSTVKEVGILNDPIGTLQKETHMDQWVIVTILIAVCAVILGICFCCIRRCFRKRRSKDKKGMKGADLKSINLLGSSYKEQVQPDMDELTANAEEPDEGEKPEVQKLGKLQFKVGRKSGGK